MAEYGLVESEHDEVNDLGHVLVDVVHKDLVFKKFQFNALIE